MEAKDMAMMRDIDSPSRRPGIGWPIAIILITLLLAAFVAGYLDGAAADGHPIMPTALGAGFVVVAGIGAMGLYLRRVGTFWRDWSRRKRLYWASLAGAGLVGAFAGALLHSGRSSTGVDTIFSYGILSPTSAVALAILWIGGLAIAITLYHRSIDDHEERAYLWACLAGWYAFIFPAPAWWVLHRAGMAPPVDAMPLFILSLIVNAIVWAWLKFR